jgi:hypothetical protein
MPGCDSNGVDGPAFSLENQSRMDVLILVTGIRTVVTGIRTVVTVIS